jgi:hypothetical protein
VTDRESELDEALRGLDSEPPAPYETAAPTARGSFAPVSSGPKRSLSPPPKPDLAVGVESVRVARAEAKAAVAEKEAIEKEQARALKPSALDQLIAWLGTPRGKATLALAGTLLAGGGWSQARETILAALGIESSAAAQAREDRSAKRSADSEAKATDLTINARELQKRIDSQQTLILALTNEVAELKARVPEIKAKPQ